MIKRYAASSDYNLLRDFSIDSSIVESRLREYDFGCLGYEIFLQDSYLESYTIEGGMIKNATCNNNCGFGIRIFNEHQTAFVSSTGISEESILTEISSCGDIYKNMSKSHSDNKNTIKVDKDHSLSRMYPQDDTSKNIYRDIIVNKLRDIDEYIRSKNDDVIQVVASISCNISKIHLISESVNRGEIRPLITMRIQVVSLNKSNGSKGIGFFSVSRRDKIDNILSDWKKTADRALNMSISNAQAVDVSPGEKTVVLANGAPSILFHEAVGHGLEADHICKEPSKFRNKLGMKVASDIVSLVDNGQLENMHGSISFDDEGTTSKNNILIKNGKLVNFMNDKQNHHLLSKKYPDHNFELSGNCRRQSYAHIPMPRMTSTYLLPGISNPSDIIADVKDGIYAVYFSGGQVDIISGDFVFSAHEAYIIRNGRVEEPIKGVSLVGNGADALTKISAIGNDLNFDSPGYCGKRGQTVNVNTGQPTVRLDSIIVGGNKA
ncbi:metalloprotease TldD [Anaplasmataceae bacterium AB001_6]|nr:metalloprotease TldD [Anaplasmataceae bacterium AB001_6]